MYTRADRGWGTASRRPKRSGLLACGPALLAAALGCATGPGGSITQLPDSEAVRQSILGHTLTLPKGFSIAVFAEGVPGVRFMAVGPEGNVYATQTGAGRVVTLPDADHNGVADRVTTLLQGLNQAHGLAFRHDTLYLAETHRVVRFRLPDVAPEIVVPSLPAGGGHFTRTILLRGDTLYVSVGSSCNVCDESDPRRAAVVQYRLDGTGEQLFATGLRNSVGLAVQPVTGEIWATNNDRDNLGDDVPPDRVNVLRKGLFYGWPQCYLPGVPNPEYASQRARCSEAIGPEVQLAAHSAPLGLTFYRGSLFPETYRGGLFVALHGSWNRSVPIGYQVVAVPMRDGKAGPARSFVTGWLEGRAHWGRPVDLLELPDGSLLISDDHGGRIYRLAYGGAK